MQLNFFIFSTIYSYAQSAFAKASADRGFGAYRRQFFYINRINLFGIGKLLILAILFSSFFLYPMQSYAMNNKVIYITDLVQKNNNGEEFITKSDLISKYAKYHDFDGALLYKPYEWDEFWQIPIHLQHCICDDYNSSIIYKLDQSNVGKEFLEYFRNYHGIGFSGFDVLKLNLNKILLVTDVHKTVPPELVHYIWTYLKHDFIENAENLWRSRMSYQSNLFNELKAVPTEPTTPQYTFKPGKNLGNETVVLGNYTISGTRGKGGPVNSPDMSCKVSVTGTDGSHVEIIIKNEVWMPAKVLCLQGKILGCIRGESSPFFEAYDIKNGHELVLNHNENRPIIACDIACSLIGLLSYNITCRNDRVPRFVLTSAITNRNLFTSDPHDKIAAHLINRVIFHPTTGEIMLCGNVPNPHCQMDIIFGAKPPFNLFASLARAQDDTVSFIEYIALDAVVRATKATDPRWDGWEDRRK